MIIVLDFGSQAAHLISRRIRELGVYAELVPYNITKEEIMAIAPEAIVLSGGPKSVYEEQAPLPPREIFALGIPILGICYGHQLIAKMLGGEVSKGAGEYGKTRISISDRSGLFSSFDEENTVWMSHSDYVNKAPKGFIVTSKSENGYISSMSNPPEKIYSVQFHPELHHTKKGSLILEEFLRSSKCKKNWFLNDFVKEKNK